ncbi:hypothetical protein ACEPAI_1770 [Sanghuangporus weigelae]
MILSHGLARSSPKKYDSSSKPTCLSFQPDNQILSSQHKKATHDPSTPPRRIPFRIKEKPPESHDNKVPEREAQPTNVERAMKNEKRAFPSSSALIQHPITLGEKAAENISQPVTQSFQRDN